MSSQAQPIFTIPVDGNTNVRLWFKTTGVPQNLPGVRVAKGQKVSLIGINKQVANETFVFAGFSPEEVATGGRPIAPGAEVDFPVDSTTAEIWIQGNGVDGVLLVVTGSAIG